jgi:hypothetical protein
MLFNRLKRGALIAIFITCSACSNSPVDHDFFSLSHDDMMKRFANYSLQDQFKFFRYGNDELEPPYTELADPIAKQGRDAVPFLLSQLENETDELGIRDIALIFEMMAFYKTYDVKSDQKIMHLLSTKIETMTIWKDVALHMLDRIKSR